MFAPKGGKRACGTQNASGKPHSTHIHTLQCGLHLILNHPHCKHTDITKVAAAAAGYKIEHHDIESW